MLERRGKDLAEPVLAVVEVAERAASVEGS